MKNMIKIEDYLHLYMGCECVFYEGTKNEYRGKMTAEQYHRCGGRLDWMKPILRPLSSMTEEELREVRRVMPEYDELSFSHKAHELMGERGSSFYYENYDEDGNYISCSISNISNLPLKCIQLLLSKGFDLFGLIEAGLAIDKTKMPKERDDERSATRDDASSTDDDKQK